jgi:putative metallohydrolase (TIGR04338 family)
MYGRRSTNAKGDRARDSQRSKLYTAETVLHGKPDFKTVQECQAFVDEVMASRYVKARWKQYIRVEPGYGQTNATADPTGGVIKLPLWSRQRAVILHEMAHCLNDQRRAYAWHGPEFAGLLLTLVHHVMGAESATKLRESFRVNRVRYNLKTVRTPRFEVPTQAAVAARKREVDNRALSADELANVAKLIRRAARAGQLGSADRKPRIHALATARLLEGAIK